MDKREFLSAAIGRIVTDVRSVARYGGATFAAHCLRRRCGILAASAAAVSIGWTYDDIHSAVLIGLAS